jgi:hypothetical protein
MKITPHTLSAIGFVGLSIAGLRLNKYSNIKPINDEKYAVFSQNYMNFPTCFAARKALAK